ncbi:putative protein C6orf118 [Dissostichus eleginoides]|uniref:Translin-associated factor X-interacting protein 1 N-terminal domain-containing protein n=1 Tax=Dissostichus eleginoides TaxID=100907 RepID=A0AAD9CMU9_DISEL|nr:putative protein C6orf118 [Dissostichus eleginoides]
MSSRCKPSPGCFRSDIHRLLLAAEAGQKTDILSYSSGHLGPRSLNQPQPHSETKQSFWKSLDKPQNPLTPQQTQTKTLTFVKKKEKKERLSQFSTVASSVESEASRSTQDQATNVSPHTDKREDTSLPTVVNCSSNVLPVQQKAFTPKMSSSSTDSEEKQHSDEKGLNKNGQLKTKQLFRRQDIAMQDLWGGINVAEIHERKLQKELRRLSAQSWPSRDRLAVFSDVFDDVCEDSPVFGRILREIKTDYDLYVNHLMASHGMSLDTSLKALSNEKESQTDLEFAVEEVCRLEQEARKALEENKRVRNKSQNVPATAGPEDSDTQNTCLSGLQDNTSNRLQVLSTWREIQHLEEEVKRKPVSSVTIADTERHVKEQKKEILRLIASNDRLKITNKARELAFISCVKCMFCYAIVGHVFVSSEGSGKQHQHGTEQRESKQAMRRRLWDEIHSDLNTECG